MTELVIDESLDASGQRRRLVLRRDGQRLVLEDGCDVCAAVTPRMVVAVLKRYGRALADDVIAKNDGFVLEPEVVIRRIGYHSRVDADVRDYLVLDSGGMKIAMLARDAGGALLHLAHVAAFAREQR